MWINTAHRHKHTSNVLLLPVLWCWSPSN